MPAATDCTRTLEPAPPAAAGREENRAPLAPGTRIDGRYEVLQAIGHGGMGIVYRVRDVLDSDRTLALKMIRSTAVRADQLSRFRAEFKIMAGLHHPNLADAYDFDARGGAGEHYFTMELVGGRDILAATEGASWREVLDVGVQVLRALSFVHSRNFVHLDLKPANVLVDARGGVKVLDFGIAAVLGTRPGRLHGTPRYAAPECQLGGFDHRADLYSMGVMLYELLCRRPPFSAPVLSDLARLHREAPIVFDDAERAALPEWLRALVARLCAKLPEERFRTANDVIEAINLAGHDYELETAETRGSYVVAHQLVGRERELARLTELIAAREHRRPCAQACWVLGQSGIGKSRLVREARQRAQMMPVAFFEASCYQGNDDELGPISELLAQLCGAAESAGALEVVRRFGGELAKLQPRITELFGIAPGARLEDAQAEGRRLVETIVEFIVALAEWEPLVLFVDDLQWARPGTVRTLQTLLVRLAGDDRRGQVAPILILGSARGDDLEGSAARALLSPGEEALVETVELARLDRESTARLLHLMLGGSELPSRFIDRMVREAAGNPFIIQEIMRALLDRSLVTIEGGRWSAARDLGELELPSSVATLFLERAATLPPVARRVLELLVAHARPLEPEVLSEALGPDRASLDEVLALLWRRQMVTRVDERTLMYRVAHDRMREAVDGALSEEHRRALHLELAEASERAFGDAVDPAVYTIAHHYFRAGDRAGTLKYARLAAQRAERENAHELAIELYRRTLSLSGDAAERDRVRLRLVDLHRALGDYVAARSGLLDLRQHAGDDLARARLTRVLAQVEHESGDSDAAMVSYREAARLLGQRVPRGRLARVAAIAGALWTGAFGRLVITRRPVERVLEVVAIHTGMLTCCMLSGAPGVWLAACRAFAWLPRAGIGPVAAEAYIALAIFLGSRAPALTAYASARAEAIALAGNDQFAASRAALGASIANLVRGRLRAGVECGRLMQRRALAAGDAYNLVTGIGPLAYCHLYLGELREAEAVLEQTLLGMRRRQSRRTFALEAMIARLRAEQGDGAPALLCQERWETLSAGERSMLAAGFHANMGAAADVAGDFAEARRHFARLRQIREASGSRITFTYECYAGWAFAELALLGRAPDRQASLAAIAEHLRAGLRAARREPYHLAQLLLVDALATWERGARRAALRRFARARHAAARLEATLLVARVDAELAARLGALGRTAEARAALERARSTYERRGALARLSRLAPTA